MKIALTYSSKEGLIREYTRSRRLKKTEEAPVDFFAEGDADETLQAILDAFRSAGHQAIGIEGDEETGKALEREAPDMVFNVAEGLFGDFRESYVPMICERLGLPYTGSDPLTLALCLNKQRTKEVLGFSGIATPGFRVFNPGMPVQVDDLALPVIIKPVAEGSSKGIFNDSVVYDHRAARERIGHKLAEYGQPVLAETFLTGDEFTVAMWGNGPDLEMLPIVSIRYDDLPPDAVPIYSYEAKWIWDTPDKPLDIFKCPADISAGLVRRIEKITKAAFNALGVRDWCRIDVRLDGKGKPYILEVNPLPGILPKPEENSCFPKAARTAGYNYQQMLLNVISIACKRTGILA